MTSITAAIAAASVIGAGLGFQGAVSPGPLQTILISETLSHGVRSGWRGAFAPVCTDPFALALALLVVSSASDVALACIAFLGAVLLCRIAWSEFKMTANDFDFQTKPRRSFASIWAVNFLNPNLWIFSFTINAIKIHDYYAEYGIGVALVYILSFFVSIVVCNLGIVFLTGYLKRGLNTKWLVGINKALGIFLLVVAFGFILLGLNKLGVLS